MLNYKSFLAEQVLNEDKEGKNLHMEHLEDEVLNGGVKGTRGAINFLQSMRDMLQGNAKRSVKVTVKWDGAPAVFAGINPENGKFFVGTKSIFNKDPKINYTPADIDANHSGGGLNDKLKVCLKYLPQLGIKGVLQGDMMFAKSDLKSENIDGQAHVTFQPNTIVYALPKDSEAGRKVLAAQMGIVWHTTYNGKTMAEMSASFGANVNNLTKTKSVWYQDADFVDATGSATMTGSETAYVSQQLAQIGSKFRTIPGSLLNEIANNGQINLLIKTYNNTKVRAGQKITNTAQHVKGYEEWLTDRYQKLADNVKSDDAKKRKTDELKVLLRWVNRHRKHLVAVFDIMNLITDTKNFLIKKLQKVKAIGTFLRTDNGFKVTAPEGFVAIANDGKAVKFVDRLEFSLANFTAAKAWDK